jgi:hypothetical protein
MQKPTADTTYAFAAGGTSHDSYADCPFRVTKKGKLYAKNIQVEDTLYFHYEENNTEGNFTLVTTTSYTNSYQDNKNETVLYIGSTASAGIDATIIRGDEVRLYGRVNGVGLGLNGATAVTSDENFKDLYEIDERYSKFFNNLEPITYIYKNIGHRHHLGFGARAVEKALIDAGLTTEEFAGIIKQNNVYLTKEETGIEDKIYDEMYSLRYEEFIALNTYMIQRAYKKIEEQQAEINDLQDKIDKLEKIING